MMRSSLPALPLALALSLALAACGGQPDPADPAANPSTGDAAGTTGAPAADDANGGTGAMPGADTASGAATDAGSGNAAAGGQAGGLTTGTSTWTCDDLTVNIAYDDVADTVTVSHANGTLLLPAHGGDGATRYGDDAGNEFQHEGSTAVLSLAGQPSRNCARS